jgi:hypothetical protein
MTDVSSRKSQSLNLTQSHVRVPQLKHYPLREPQPQIPYFKECRNQR